MNGVDECSCGWEVPFGENCANPDCDENPDRGVQAAVFHLHGQLVNHNPGAHSYDPETRTVTPLRRPVHHTLSNTTDPELGEFEREVARVDAFEEAHVRATGRPVPEGPMGGPAYGPGSWGDPIVLNGNDTTTSLLDKREPSFRDLVTGRAPKYLGDFVDLDTASVQPKGVGPDHPAYLSDREILVELLDIARRAERRAMYDELRVLTARFDARRR